MVNKKNGKSVVSSIKIVIFSIIGVCSLIFGIAGFSVELSEGGSGTGIFLATFFTIVGGALLYLAIKTKKSSVKYKRYLDLIANQNVKNIDEIASATRSSYEKVSKDLQKMIDVGYLNNAYIHQADHEIVLKQQHGPALKEQAQASVSPQITSTPPTATQTKAVRCTGCSANNVVTVGTTSSCEYCGTPINA